MITSYILILAFSAWLITAALVVSGVRICRAMDRTIIVPAPSIALGVALAFLVVVAAPGWLVVIALITAIATHKHRLLPFTSIASWFIALGALIPMILAPVLGAPSWLAVDAAIIAASLLGALIASHELPKLDAALPAFLVAIIGLGLHAAMRGGLHAS